LDSSYSFKPPFAIITQDKIEVIMRKYLWFFLIVPVWSFAQITVPASFSATFVQKVTTPQKKLTRYTGSVLLNRSREFLWRYRTPTKREICGDGSRVRIVDHDLEQVTVYKVGSLLDLMQLLKRAKRYRNDIYLTRYHGTRYTLKVNQKGQLEQIAFQDDLDNIVNVHFHQIRYGSVPVSQEKLRCHVPKSYDVIRG
jgi:outer membrane lipoprotein carrier protein